MSTYRKCKSEKCNRLVAPNRTVCQPCHSSMGNYGITRPEAQDLLDNQGGSCAVCHNQITFTGNRAANNEAAVIDHCHTSGEVRGILCGKCNLGLGRFDDDIDRLFNAILYLKGGHGNGTSNRRIGDRWSDIAWKQIVKRGTSTSIAIIVNIIGQLM